MKNLTGRVRRMSAPVFVVTMLLVTAGGTGAVAGKLIGSREVADNSLRSADIRDGAITGRDVRDGSLTEADFAGSGSEPDVRVYTWTAPFELADLGDDFYSVETTSKMTVPAGSILTGRAFTITDATCAASFRAGTTNGSDLAVAQPDGREVLSWVATGSENARVTIYAGERGPEFAGCAGTFSLELGVQEYSGGPQVTFN